QAADPLSSGSSRLKAGYKSRFALFLVLLASLSAQQPPPVGEGVKFQSTTQLVVETVVVKDKNGKPIEGLTAQDFIVTEDGKPQTVSFCEFQKLSEAAADAPPTVAPVRVDPVTRTQISPEKPGDIRYRDRRLMAMYFDMTAMPTPAPRSARITASSSSSPPTGS